MNDKMLYWINQDGVQAGPVTSEQLKEMAVNDSAYVWRAGMDDWCRITECPELDGLYEVAPAEEPAVTDNFLETAETDAPETAAEPDPVQEEPMLGTPLYPPVPEPMMPQPAPAAQPYAPLPAAQPTTGETVPKCPPTNLVWAILATILCCLPLGVVAIIYSTKVSQKYQQGDYAAAEHYSEVSAWWCIGTIVGGLILSPFVSLIQMALMQ
ncbi:MAG: CD225/dispanin family protein [Muribaculaceae bacterium]|nr:CD225/dispanin family protein [Muribaculaceae bacterium]